MKRGLFELESPIVYAPLAGCSDYPFREMAARYRPNLMFCEMVKMEALIRKNKATYRMLDYSEAMRPIGGQICGTKPKLARETARIIEDLGFDVVDLNCGCPADKVTKDGSGSAMLKSPERIGEVIEQMVAAVKIPVTIKIRVGWDERDINATKITRIAEEAGARAIFVHGRTRKQGYKGPANWDHIAACKKQARSIKVIGNGDLFSAEAALSMLEKTECDGVLIARGTFGQPWIAEDIRLLREGKRVPKKDFRSLRQALLDHLAFSSAYKDERGALLDMRRICCWYFKNIPRAREFRKEASRASTLLEVRRLIEMFQMEHYG